MPQQQVSIRQSIYLGLSILLHCLLFGSVAAITFLTPAAPPKPKMDSFYEYVPAYQYSPASTPSQAAAPPKPQPPVDIKPTDEGFDLAKVNYNQPHDSVLKDRVGDLSMNDAASQPKDDKTLEPIRMVGEKLLTDPLQKILGRAITKHLFYPALARQLYQHGIATIGFVLHPSGEISEARIVKTSKVRSLDLAALYAITESSPIGNVDIYLKEAEYLTVNIIF